MAISVECCVDEDELTAAGWLLFGPPSQVDERVTKRHLCLRHGQILQRFLIVMRSFTVCEFCDGDGRYEEGAGEEAHIRYCVRCHGLGVLDADGETLDWLT